MFNVECSVEAEILHRLRGFNHPWPPHSTLNIQHCLSALDPAAPEPMTRHNPVTTGGKYFQLTGNSVSLTARSVS
jgi:hypothetical protein